MLQKSKESATDSACHGKTHPKLASSWASLFTFMTRKHAPTLVLAVLFALGAAIVPPALAVFLGNMFDSFTLFGGGTISGHNLLDKITKSSLGLLGLGGVSWVLNGAYYALFIAFGELQARNVRSKLFSELLERDIEWFESREDGVGAFLSGLQAHVHELQIAASHPLGLAVQYSFRTLASLGLAFYTSWKLSLVTLAGVPVFSAVIAFFSSRIKLKIDPHQSELTTASKIAGTAIKFIDTVKCHNAQSFEARNFATTIDAAAVHYLKQAQFNAVQISLIRIMGYGMFVQGFWYGSYLASTGQLSAGKVLRAFWACLMATQSIEQVLPQMILLEQGKFAAASLKAVLKGGHPRENRNGSRGTMYPEHCEGDIQIGNISFAYPSQPQKEVLKSASFFFPSGETTFVIGQSGSGKSTLSSLLMRFYPPTSGHVYIDGTPIQELDIKWIRNNITLVEQKSVLFNESILTNIAFGRRDYEQITKSDIRTCVDLAMLQDTLNGLPNGIDTSVGPGGNMLSGGQRQRVAIARARLRDTPILILDEPTSALDLTNRVAVMNAIREWRRGKTTIIITHDMTQILPTDFVYIIQKGSVVQAGYRHELEGYENDDKRFFFGTHENGALEATASDKATAIEIDNVSDGGTDSGIESDQRPVSPPPEHLRLAPPRPSFPSHRTSLHLDPTLQGRRLSWNLASVQSDVIGDPSRMCDKRREGGPRRIKRPGPAESPDVEVSFETDDNTFPLVDMRRSFQAVGEAQETAGEARPPIKRNTASIARIMLTIVPNLTTVERCLLVLGFVFALAHASATPVFAYCVSRLFSTFYAPGGYERLTMRWSLGVLGVALGDGLVSYFMHYFLEYCGQAWIDSLRKKAFTRILDQPKAWFERERNTPSKLTACIDQNAEDMRNLVGRFAGFMLVAAAIMAMAVVWSLVVCWKMTLVALACGPPIYAITRGFEKTNGLWESRCNAAGGVVSEVVVETFMETRTVRTLTLEPYFHKKHISAISHALTLGLKRAIYSGSLFGLVESTIVFVSALIFYYGAVLASSSGYTVQDIMTVLSLLLFSIGYANLVLSWVPQINSSQDTATRLLRLANLPEGASHEYLGQRRISHPTPIVLSHLDFRYPSRPDAPVLRDVSITIPASSCTAIVGCSGSGKSTIASLLLALYEAPVSRPNSGLPTVSLGGYDIRQLHTPTLRSMISIVSQQPTIFPDTIRANISYGLDPTSPLASMANVRAAARAAGIDDFIASLPRGYYTIIGDGGVGISGGQAQRLVIARALVRQPQVLILDEATSSLDGGSARVVRQTVQTFMAHRPEMTVIIITHAREMMEIADKVVVLEHGAVVEEGPYHALAGRGRGKLRALLDAEQASSV